MSSALVLCLYTHYASNCNGVDTSCVSLIAVLSGWAVFAYVTVSKTIFVLSLLGCTGLQVCCDHRAVLPVRMSSVEALMHD